MLTPPAVAPRTLPRVVSTTVAEALVRRVATNASAPDPLSRAARSPTAAPVWRAMPSRAESPWRTPTAQTDQRDRGWSASDSARAFHHTALAAAPNLTRNGVLRRHRHWQEQ